MKKITMQDVADKAKVSKSTVSQFINKRYEYMSVDTKKRIEQSIKELGYIPNYIAKSLKQKKTFTIGVIVANILHTFSTEIIRAIEDVCENNNIHMFVCNADDNPEKEKSYMEMLIAKQVDGLIIFPTGGNIDFYQQLKQANFPIVFVDRRIDSNLYPTFMLDNYEAVNIALTQLLKGNPQEVGMVTTSLDKSVTPRIERLNAFKHLILSHNIPLKSEYIVAAKRKDIFTSLNELWESGNFPKAMFATNDLSLIELLRFIKYKKLNIPEDVAVTAIDDSPFLEVSTPPITVVEQPTFDIGRDASNKLLELIKVGNLNESYDIIRYEPKLIKRESV